MQTQTPHDNPHSDMPHASESPTTDPDDVLGDAIALAVERVMKTDTSQCDCWSCLAIRDARAWRIAAASSAK